MGTGYCFGAPYVCEHLAKDWLLAGTILRPPESFLHRLIAAMDTPQEHLGTRHSSMKRISRILRVSVVIRRHL